MSDHATIIVLFTVKVWKAWTHEILHSSLVIIFISFTSFLCIHININGVCS